MMIVLRDDPHVTWEGALEFRLTYEGPLLSETVRDGTVRRGRAEHKQTIRKIFHSQLRRWWGVSPYLRLHGTPKQFSHGQVLGMPYPKYSKEELAGRFNMFGYNFVPLVTRDMEVFCSLEILYLRFGDFGGVLNRVGDIDNRVKTLFDGLTMPRDATQLGSFTVPQDDEKPFFCLLEDDSVITKVTVESDVLLQPTSDPADPNDARVVISVKLRPGRVTAENLGFA